MAHFENTARHEELANKIVYANGLNVVYDKDGYAKRNWNPDHPLYKDTTMSIHGQPKAEALKGDAWEHPSVVGLLDWNFGTPNTSKKIENDADFDWRTWGRTDKEFAELYGETARDAENGAIQ